HRLGCGIVYAGFSQGVSMAFRAAVASTRSVSGVIAVGGDIPPEIETQMLARVGNVLLSRGARDGWYTSNVYPQEVARPRAAGVRLEALEFDGGHEWSGVVQQAASIFLRACHP